MALAAFFEEAQIDDEGWTMQNFQPEQVPVVSDCQHFKNCESYMVNAEDDDGQPRVILQLKYCPLHKLCSHGSWYNHMPWCVVCDGDTEDVFMPKLVGHLKHHLIESGKHAMPLEEANDFIHDLMVNQSLVWVKSWDQPEARQKYRQQVEKAAATSAANMRDGGKGGTGPKKRRRGCQSAHAAAAAPSGSCHEPMGADEWVDDREDGVVESIVPSLALGENGTTTDFVQQALLSALGLDAEVLAPFRKPVNIQYAGGLNPLANIPKAPRPQGGSHGNVMVPIEKLRTMRESIRRAEMATGSALCALVSDAKKLRTENEVLTQARRDVDDLIKYCNAPR
jgi:hypothetical protein